jgi:hypothetical protein
VDNLADDVEAEKLLTSPRCATSDSSLNLQSLETKPGISSTPNDSEVPSESHSMFSHVIKICFSTDETSNTATGLGPVGTGSVLGVKERMLQALLDLAIHEGDLRTVEQLVDEGVDVNRYDWDILMCFSETIVELFQAKTSAELCKLIVSWCELHGLHSEYLATRTPPLWRIQKIPVVEAAKAGHGKVVRILLQRGAAASDLESLMAPMKKEFMKRERQYRCLRKHFLQQYLFMDEAAQSSTTELQQLGKSFQNHREAWAAGIRTMRRLCNGKSPQGLHNIAAFLCISKAMSETLDGAKDGYYSTQFLHDVERWQVLFTSEELGAYQELVYSMWGVCLSESASQSWEASDILILTHFQSLFSALISQEDNLSFPHTHKHGLESSQRRFLSRNYQTSAHLSTEASVSTLDPREGKDSQSQEALPPEPPDIHFSPKTNCLEANIENDLSAARLNVTVVLLMAGAIFAIIIIFLQGLSLNRILIQPCRIYSLT